MKPDGSIDIWCFGVPTPKAGAQFNAPNGEACEVIEVRALSSANTQTHVWPGAQPTHRMWFRYLAPR